MYFYHTGLPESLRYLRIRNLRVGTASVDLAFERHAETAALNILRRTGDLEVIALK